jgi:uncharacterized protein YbjT (DUF2867 family)
MQSTTLVVGATGKTGRRVSKLLTARGVPVRSGSRTAVPGFDWEKPDTWGEALRGVQSAYVSYYPDLAAPGADGVVAAFARLAVQSGVRRLVLLSGRGEAGALLAERAVRESGAEWTIVRSSWFNQNFSEGFFADQVLGGEVALPADGVKEPFIDADDVADVAAAALTEDRHVDEIYEVTGPRLLTFAEAVLQVAKAARRDIRYRTISMERFGALLAEQSVPLDFVWLIRYLFTDVLDGRNAHLSDGVKRALGREPRDFSDYARAAAAAGVWSPVSADGRRAAAGGTPHAREEVEP